MSCIVFVARDGWWERERAHCGVLQVLGGIGFDFIEMVLHVHPIPVTVRDALFMNPSVEPTPGPLYVLLPIIWSFVSNDVTMINPAMCVVEKAITSLHPRSQRWLVGGGGALPFSIKVSHGVR